MWRTVKWSANGDFFKYYNLTNLIKQPIWFKNPEKPKCIDPILTNKPRSLQNTFVVETEIDETLEKDPDVFVNVYSKFINRHYAR